MTRKITIINQDAGYLMIDIANAYAGKGYDVNLITGRLLSRNKTLQDSVRIQKIIRYHRKSAYTRLYSWLIGTCQIFLLLLFRNRNRELLIVTNPPTAPLLMLFSSKRFSILVYDIYPDALHELGYLNKNAWIIKQWEKKAKHVFKKADRIITITNGMKKVLEKYTSGKPIEVIPIWSDNEHIKPLNKDKNPFIQEFNLENKFVVLYSGNLGMAHKVEVILQLAEAISDPDIQFIIIGHGEKEDLLRKRILACGLNNCMMLPLQDADKLPFTFGAADISIVTLGKGASKLSIPSKTYNYLSAGSPLLCIADSESELYKLVEEYEVGKCFDPEKLYDMTRYILSLKNNRTLHLKYRRRAIDASKNFGEENAIKITG